MARFDHLSLVVDSDAEHADLVKFFRDVLALPVDGTDGYVEVDAGAITIAVHRGSLVDHKRPLGGVLLQMRSDDVRAETEAILDRGGLVALGPVETDWGTRSTYIDGPHALQVELYEWLPGQPG